MHRTWIAAIVTVGLTLGFGHTADGERKNAACPAPAAYRGQPLRAPLALPEIVDTIGGEFGTDAAARLRRAAIEAQKAASASSMTVAVAVPGSASWTLEMSGASPRDTTSSGGPLHYWASAGKTFVAIVILQLVEEGKIALDDKVSRWVKEVPNGEAITIEHLLAHTSGLFSANEDLRVRKAHRAHSPTENLAVSKKHGPLFCPGEAWRYSNTGYDLLGMIIERVDGKPYPAAIDARIIAPLGLKRLRVLRPGEASSGVAPLVSTKERPIDPSWPGAAGPIVGSADDMIRVWHALLTHRLVKADSVRKMFAQLYPMFTPVEFYGLGVMCFDVPETDGSKTTWIGHGGGTPGASAIIAFSPADRAFVAVALTGDGSAPATANLLLRELRSAPHGVARTPTQKAPAAAPASMSAEARAHLEEIIAVLQREWLHRDGFDWPGFTRQVMEKAGTAQTIPETYDAIRAGLKLLGDRHSYYVPAEGPTIFNPESPTQSTGECTPAAAVTPALPADVGYIQIRVASGKAGADAVDAAIRERDRPGLAGWIVDMRNSRGGNMWPFVAAMGPLLGEGTLGFFIDAQKRPEPWGYIAGRAWLGTEAQTVAAIEEPHPLATPNPRVAVLTDIGVASSGEALAIAFRTRPNTRSFGTATCGLSTAVAQFPLKPGGRIGVVTSVMADRTTTPYGKTVTPDEVVNDPAAVVPRALGWLRGAQ